MQISSIKQSSFKGSINVSGLSNKQKQAFDTICPALEKQVKSIKNLNLNINGSLDKDIISIWSGKEPRYIHMSTQVRSATVPTAEIAIESLEPKTILESAQNLINKHLNSKFYKETIESVSKHNLFTRFLNRIKSFKQ